MNDTSTLEPPVAEKKESSAITPEIVTKKSEYKLPNSLTEKQRSSLRIIEHLENLLDDRFVLPGTHVRLGWDSIIGLVPVLGDLFTTIMSCYLIWQAQSLNISNWGLFRMLGNVLLDFIVGTVPLLGDFLDIAFRANRRNLKLIRKELHKRAEKEEAQQGYQASH